MLKFIINSHITEWDSSPKSLKNEILGHWPTLNVQNDPHDPNLKFFDGTFDGNQKFQNQPEMIENWWNTGRMDCNVTVKKFLLKKSFTQTFLSVASE